MLVYGHRSLCSNLVGIDPEKLYRATFIGQYGLCCCIVWPSFLFDCFVKFGQLARIFWANGLPPPLAENCPYAYAKRFAVITTFKSISVKKKVSAVITLFRTVGIRLFCKREPSVLFYNTSGFIISAYNLTLWFAITAFSS